MNRLLASLLCVFIAMAIQAKNTACANISLTDGTVMENVELELPRVWTNEVKYAIDGKKEKHKSEQVDYMIIWHKDTPDNKSCLRYLQCGDFDRKTGEYKPNKKKKEWFMLESAGEHLALWIMFWQAKVKADKIELKLGDGPSFPGTAYYFQKKGDSVAYKIAFDPARPGMVRDWLKAFLSDDPELVERITDKGYFNRRKALRHGNDYNPFFFEDIAVDYNPKK